MLPVILLTSSASAATRRRTIESLSAQSVAIETHATPVDLAILQSDYVVFALSGVFLDATACERAVWFLATHPSVSCVTGAIATGATDAAASSQQFLVARTAGVQRVLAPFAALHPATAIAVAIGLLRESGRGGGWISEPVIRVSADASVMSAVALDAQDALRSLGLEAAALVDMGVNGVPLVPQQQLMCIERPVLDVRRVPCDGLRILVLVQGFPMGGYTAFNADLLPQLVANGHVVTTCSTEIWRSDWRLDQVRAVSPDIHHAHAVVPSMAVPAYVDWLVASRAIDVVLLSHTYVGLHLLPYLRSRHPSVAFVDYVHTDWFEAGMYGSYAAMAVRWEGQLDAQLVTSHALAKQLAGAGCEPAAVRVAHIGVDTAKWSHTGPRLQVAREALGAQPETVVILFSGRLSPEKRPHLAVDVTSALVADGHDVLLVFAGDGPLRSVVESRANAQGLGARCKLLGELDEDVLRHVYAAADIFLAPSEIEGIARSLYEAMAMGCVPVVSDVGGQRELVVAGTGTLVSADRDDATPYLDGVRNWLSPEARERAAVGARDHIVAHFDSSQTVLRVAETLQLAGDRRRDRQVTVPAAMEDELAVMSLEICRRHFIRSVGR